MWCVMTVALAALSAVVAWPSRAAGQILTGEWVNESQRRIEEHRKTRLRVLVLDEEGKPAALRVVRVTQLSHDFVWGIAAAKASSAWPLPGVWRCFNALSLDPSGDLAHTKPMDGPMDGAAVDAGLASLPEGWMARWGGVISAEVGAVPPWMGEKKGRDLDGLLNAHVAEILQRYSGQAGGFDLYTNLIDHGFVESRLGEGAVRALFENAKAVRPGASIGIRFDDALEGPRLPGMIQRVRSLRESFVPFDHIAVSGRFGGTLVQATMRGAVEWIGQLEMPVTIVGLEVGGGSASSAAINLEMVLRTFFAEPTINGIYFSGMTKQDVQDSAAAFVTEEGVPTATGELLERMVRGQWWTDVEARTDTLGNARAKVFAGRYRVSVMLGEEESSVEVWLPPQQGERTVVLQPIKQSEK